MEQTWTKLERERAITRTSFVGIAANVFLAAFKALAGLLSGSITILLDAVNNLSDMLSSVIAILGIKLAKRKPDKSHPFGHGRVEYFSAILVAGIVFAAGAASLVESVKKIFHPEPAQYTAVTLVIVLVAIAVKLLLGRFVSARGKKYNSDALIASGSDASFDAVISASTLVGAAVTLLWGVSIDGWIGVVISVFILKAGIEMLLSPVSQVLGTRSPESITGSIKADIRAFDGVQGVYDLVLHNYGPNYAMGSVHVEVPDTMTALEVYTLTKEIQRAIVTKYSIFLTVGIYAVDTVHPEKVAMQAAIRETVLAFDGILNIHAICIDDSQSVLSFDMVTDFKVSDRDALRTRVADAVTALYPAYRVEISIDLDYSD